MSTPKTWFFLRDCLQERQPAALLYVLDSQGSSPGRQGFRMVVAEDGRICGSIGGGIMEFKLVEKARVMLKAGERRYWLRRQVHRKEEGEDRSGMICSGEQLVLIWPIYDEEENLKKLFAALAEGAEGQLELSPEGFGFSRLQEQSGKKLIFHSEQNWQYLETLNPMPWVHIFGAGHVGLALSRQLSWLGFRIAIYDDRSELNTLEQNQFASRKLLINYEQLDDRAQIQPEDYVILMTFGYRSDKLLLKQLLKLPCIYLGMMGSEAKTAQLFAELKKEGFSEAAIDQVFAPIGLSIYSKTPEEIAVSIAGELILHRNKKLPTGRTERPKK